jgi:hypothetical protein
MSWIVSIENEHGTHQHKHAQYVNDMMDEVRKAAEQIVDSENDCDFIKVYLSEHPDA